jgi:hypothetical protein
MLGEANEREGWSTFLAYAFFFGLLLPVVLLFFDSLPSFFDASPYLIRQAPDRSSDPGATPAKIIP